jgi:hypothetical protein
MARHTYNILIHPTELCIPTSAKGKEPFKFYEKEIITIKKKREKGVRQQQQDKIIQPRCWRIKKEKKPKTKHVGASGDVFHHSRHILLLQQSKKKKKKNLFSSSL